MQVVVGIILLAVGAGLVWAIDKASTIGVALMALGGVGILASLLMSARETSGRGSTQQRSGDPLTPLWETREGDDSRPSSPRPPWLPPSA